MLAANKVGIFHNTYLKLIFKSIRNVTPHQNTFVYQCKQAIHLWTILWMFTRNTIPFSKHLERKQCKLCSTLHSIILRNITLNAKNTKSLLYKFISIITAKFYYIANTLQLVIYLQHLVDFRASYLVNFFYIKKTPPG